MKFKLVFLFYGVLFDQRLTSALSLNSFLAHGNAHSLTTQGLYSTETHCSVPNLPTYIIISTNMPLYFCLKKQIKGKIKIRTEIPLVPTYSVFFMKENKILQRMCLIIDSLLQFLLISLK